MDRRVLVAGLIAGVVVACADPAKHMAAGAMAGVGGALIDAGDMLGDGAVAGRSDAAAGAGGAGGIGGVLSDAGSALIDAGAALDGSSILPDADAQQPRAPTILEAPCDIESGFRTSGAPSSGYTSFYAEFDAGGRDPLDFAAASAVVCDIEFFGESTGASPCPDGATCTNLPLPPIDCYVTPVSIAGSNVRIYCGSRSESTTVGGVTTVTGSRYNSVRLVIP